jgi:hypothetical protein
LELAEIEGLVAELESRLDRLRSLYDQYFMGIEKLEPNVPRKDIDRRIFVLRKVQIRNTGIRFRFQMILQRYNTYQTYWQRICRKIDDGTYKRHMLRAEARFGDGVGGAQRKTSKSIVPPPSSQTTTEAEDTSWLDEDFPEPALPRIAPPPIAGVHAGAPSPTAFPAAPTTSKWRKAVPAEPRASSPPPPPAVPRVAPPSPAPAPPPLPGPRQAPPLPAAANASKPAAAPLPTNPTPARSLPAPSRFTRPPVPTAAPAPPPPKVVVTAPASPPRPTAAASPPPAARPASPPPAPATAPKGADLPDDRVRQIYAQYVDTKRKQNESTAAITFDALAKSLRESSAKLREKHGRAVDFEVAVKDGKTILKPVVK